MPRWAAGDTRRHRCPFPWGCRGHLPPSPGILQCWEDVPACLPLPCLSFPTCAQGSGCQPPPDAPTCSFSPRCMGATRRTWALLPRTRRPGCGCSRDTGRGAPPGHAAPPSCWSTPRAAVPPAAVRATRDGDTAGGDTGGHSPAAARGLGTAAHPTTAAQMVGFLRLSWDTGAEDNATCPPGSGDTMAQNSRACRRDRGPSAPLPGAVPGGAALVGGACPAAPCAAVHCRSPTAVIAGHGGAPALDGDGGSGSVLLVVGGRGPAGLAPTALVCPSPGRLALSLPLSPQSAPCSASSSSSPRWARTGSSSSSWGWSWRW